MLLSLSAPLAGQAGCGSTQGTGCELVSSTPISGTTGGCSTEFAVVGPPESCGVSDGGSVSQAQCKALCPPGPSGMTALGCSLSTAPAGSEGQSTLVCEYTFCGTGRRPLGLLPARGEGDGSVAGFLGRVAHLEAASVVAFERLADELEVHGAPARLVRGARRSARDEVRHARVTRRFAERAGARPLPVEVEAAPPGRSLEAIAVDNAVEGCVRETFGALVAMRQAERARDPEVRRAMASIAADEARHADLSWALSRWLDGRLDAATRRRVRRARDRAVEHLLRDLGVEPHASLVDTLGLPTAAEARAACADLRSSLWS